MIEKIVILGAGNVSTHFVSSLLQAKFNIVQIFSRTKSSAEKLGKKYNIKYTDNINSLNSDADVFLFLLSDTGIKETANKFPFKDKMLFHSSGSIPISIFKKLTDNYGVIYPFQTFKKEIDIDFRKVPLCIEYSNSRTKIFLDSFINQLGCKSYLLNSEQRKTLHIAAVFACNFMNHTVHVGETILADNKINKEILKPLLEQSFKNIINFGAENVQTGPAVREDIDIIKNHLEHLQNEPELKNIYKNLTENIIKLKKK